jgi:hypothetical protein
MFFSDTSFRWRFFLMGTEAFPRIYFHRLAQPGDSTGVSCDRAGPAIGPIRLLTRTVAGFTSRPIAELNGIFSYVGQRPVDCSDLAKRLTGVAKALNDGELARATFATLFLHLPSLSDEQAQRAAEAVKLVKASPDDPEHPGWPKGTEGGKGGQFRPKDGAAAETTTAEKLARLAVRRQLRRALVHTLLRQAARLAIEAAGDAVPGLDVVAGAATIADLAVMAEENAALKRDADAAIKFVQNGPYSLEELRASPDDKAFSSFSEFKKIKLAKYFGPAGDGYDYHHIVEQSAKGDIPESELQSTQNIVRIPRLLHEEIGAQYSLWQRELDGSLRASLNGASLSDRRNIGLKVMRDVGILKGE